MKRPLFSDRHFYVLDSVGLTIGRQIVPHRAIAHLRRVVQRISDDRVDAKFPMLGEDSLFMDLMSHPWILSGAERVLGSGFRFDHCFGLKQGKGSALANLHGGPLTCQGASFYISSLAREGACWSGRISVGIALSRQSPKTGGMCYIPGSHKSCCAIHGKEVLKRYLTDDGFDDESIVVPTLEPGDVTFFVDALVHGATAWRQPSPRCVLYYMYSPGFMAWRPYSETSKNLPLARTSVERRLLRPPFVAEISEGDGRWGDNQWRRPVK